MLRTRVLAATLLSAVVLTACGGSSSSNDSKSGSDSGSGKGSGSDSEVSVPKTGNDELDKLFAKAKTANVKVTYKQGKSDSTLTLVQYNGDSAFIEGDSNGIYSTGGKTVSCDGSGADAECFELPGGAQMSTTMQQAFFGAFSSLFTIAQQDGAGVFSDSSSSEETIAGRDAKCATITSTVLTQGKGSLKVCIDAETGVLLKGETSDGDSTDGIVATAYAESTKDDVTPPAAPSSLPSN